MTRRPVLISLGYLVISASALAASPCTMAQLNPAPGRFTGITWDGAHQHVLMLDLSAGEVRTYSTSGALVKRWANPGSGPFEFSRPLFLVPTASGFLLQDEGSHFIELDRELTPIASHDLDRDQPEGERTEGGSFHWVGTADGILGYGDVKPPGEPWTTGLLKVTWSPIVRFELLRRLSRDGPSREPYRLGTGTMASRDRRGYLLSFGRDYGVLEVDGSSVRLRRGLPEAFGALPQIPPSQGKANATERSLALASSTGAAHLYSDGSNLFVVLRDMRSGTRRWLLARYDPEAERVTGVWLLPGSAIDVLLAPGPKRWALVELAGWRADDTMAVGKLAFFSSEPLQKPGGTVDAPTPLCEQ